MFKISNKISSFPKNLLKPSDHPIGRFRDTLVDFLKKATLATFFRAARETTLGLTDARPGPVQPVMGAACARAIALGRRHTAQHRTC
jgi:hypothetical protein